MRPFLPQIAFVSLLVIVSVSCKARKFNSQTNSARPNDNVNCGTMSDAQPPNPIHCQGKITIAGDWRYDEIALEANEFWKENPLQSKIRYMAPLFGATVAFWLDGKPFRNKDGSPYIIRDQHYHLGDGSVGIRPVPVAPTQEETVFTGGEPGTKRSIKGFTELDKTIRKQQNLNDANDPIWTIGLSYLDGDPYLTVDRLADYTRGRTGHVNIYIGEGRVRQQNGGGPEGTFWEIKQQPVTHVGVSLKGVKQSVLNANLIAVTRLMNELNEGPYSNMAKDQRNDAISQQNLRQALDFFRVWIEGGEQLEKLKTSREYQLYCAEFVQLVLNIGLNLPLTPDYFSKVWGPTAGPKLWTKVLERIAEVDKDLMFQDKPQQVSQLIKAVQAEPFKPLWERDGVAKPTQLIEDNKSFAWPLEVAGDSIAGAIETFGNWPVFGPKLSMAILLNTLSLAQQRTSVTPEKYFAFALPAAAKMFKHYSALKGFKDPNFWNGTVMNELPPELTAGLNSDQKTMLLRAIDQEKEGALKMPQHRSEAEAWAAFEKDMTPIIAAYRGFKPPLSSYQLENLNRLGSTFIQTRIAEVQRLVNAATTPEAKAAATKRLARLTKYATLMQGQTKVIDTQANPIQFMRVAQGMRKTHPDVKALALATMFDASLLRPNPKAPENTTFSVDIANDLIAN